MKTYILTLFVLLHLNSAHADGPVISGSATGTAQVHRMSIEKQKSIFLKCSGGPDAVSNSQRNLSGADQGASGTIQLTDDHFYRNFSALTLSWNSEFKDRTFIVNFSHVIGAPIKTEHDSQCGHDENYSKVTATTAELNSLLQMIIPEDVWFVRIEDLDSTQGESNLQTNLNGGNPLRAIQDSGVSTDSYFSTLPGDTISLAVKWNPASQRTATVTRRLKVTLVGKDGCEEQLINRKNTALGSLTAGLTGKAQSANAVELVGCLLNDKVTNKVLNESSAGDLSQILEMLETFSFSVNTTSVSTNGNQSQALKLISQYASYKLAYRALKEITGYCQDVTIKNSLSTDKGVIVNGFMYNHYYLTRIIHRLNSFNYERFSQFAVSIQNLQKEFPTYLDLKRNKKAFDQVSKAYEVLKRTMNDSTSIYSIGSLPFSSTLHLYDQISITALDRDAVNQIKTELLRLAQKETQFRNKLGSLIWDLAQGSPNPIDTSALSNLVQSLYVDSIKLVTELKSKQAWFDTPNPADRQSPYFNDMVNYNMAVMSFAGNKQDLDLIKHNSGFLKAYDPTEVLKGANICMQLNK